MLEELTKTEIDPLFSMCSAMKIFSEYVLFNYFLYHSAQVNSIVSSELHDMFICMDIHCI